jgi:hypothetical protein
MTLSEEMTQELVEVLNHNKLMYKQASELVRQGDTAAALQCLNNLRQVPHL